MLWRVDEVQQSWSEAPFAVIKGALSGRRLEMFTQRNELGGYKMDASWPRWAVITIAVVLLIPVKLICLGNAVVKKMCDLVLMARGQRIVRPCVMRRPPIRSNEGALSESNAGPRLELVLRAAHRIQTTLGENQQKPRIAINNQQIEDWSRIEFQYFGKIGQDVFRRSICSYLRQDESARLAAVCKKYFVFFRKDVETTIGEEYTKEILATDKAYIQAACYLSNVFYSEEEVRTRELFHKTGIPYPATTIFQTGSRDLKWAKSHLKLMNSDLRQLYSIDGVFSLWNNAFSESDFTKHAAFRLVSKSGSIGFAFRCTIRIPGDRQDNGNLNSGILMISSGIGRHHDRCYMHIVRMDQFFMVTPIFMFKPTKLQWLLNRLKSSKDGFVSIGTDISENECEVQLETTALSSLEGEIPA